MSNCVIDVWVMLMKWWYVYILWWKKNTGNGCCWWSLAPNFNFDQLDFLLLSHFSDWPFDGSPRIIILCFFCGLIQNHVKLFLYMKFERQKNENDFSMQFFKSCFTRLWRKKTQKKSRWRRINNFWMWKKNLDDRLIPTTYLN